MLQGDVNYFVCGQLWFTRNGRIGPLCLVSSPSQLFKQGSIEMLGAMNTTIFVNFSNRFLTLFSIVGFIKLSLGVLIGQPCMLTSIMKKMMSLPRKDSVPACFGYVLIPIFECDHSNSEILHIVHT